MGNTVISLYSIPLIILQCSFLTAMTFLVKRVLFPTILTFPWHTTSSNSSPNPHDQTITVILAGSYNPPHNGHLAMLSYLSQRYGRVLAVIGTNPKKTYDVSPEERAEMLRTMIHVSNNNDDHGRKNNVRVEVVSDYIWRFAMKNNGKLLFRGIRSWSKDGKDEMQLLALNTWGPIIYGPLKWPLPTLYLEGDPRYNHISSTLIRNLCQTKESKGDDDGDDETSNGTTIDKNATELALSSLVPKEVTKKIRIAYSRCS